MEFDHRTLTEAVNQIQLEPFLLTNLLFPATRQIEVDSDYVDTDIISESKNLAQVRRSGAPAGIVAKSGFTAQSVRLPAIREKIDITAIEALQRRMAGQPVNLQGQDPAAFVEKKMAEALLRLKNRIGRTMELMVAQAVQGEISMTGDDFAVSVTYDIPSANKPSALTSTARWGQSAADILGNLRAWKRLANRGGGRNPDTVLLGAGASDAFVKDATVRTILNQNNVIAGKLDLTRNDGYIGSLLGMDFYTVDDQYLDGSTATDYLGEKKVVLANTRTADKMYFGPIMDLDAGQSMVKFFSKSWTEQDPSAVWLLVESHPLPVIHEPGAIVVTEVV